MNIYHGIISDVALGDLVTARHLKEQGGIFYNMGEEQWCDLPTESYQRVSSNLYRLYREPLSSNGVREPDPAITPAESSTPDDRQDNAGGLGEKPSC